MKQALFYAAALSTALSWADAFTHIAAATPATTATTPIQHVIIIFQENQSFDHYFGTYPGANGIPAGTCVPYDPNNQSLGCLAPYHDQTDFSFGGPHQASDAQRDLNDGITHAKMNGFILSQTLAKQDVCAGKPNIPICRDTSNSWSRHDVVGYHDANELPNYWQYAQHFVLQDMMFAGVRSWSTPSHLDMTSEWVAVCSDPKAALTCQTVNAIYPPKPGITSLPWSAFSN